jgi:beta-galactosidase
MSVTAMANRKGRDTAMRERLLMDCGWKFYRGDIPFEKGHGGWAKAGNFNMGAVDPSFNDSSWRTLDVPHDFVVEGNINETMDASATDGTDGIAGALPGQSLYTMHGSLPMGVGWYRKTIFIPESDLGRRLVLEFDGVARNSTVWINGHHLGQHLSGYASFRYDITDLLNYGNINTVVVRADATEYEGWFYEGGGIYRHVWLVKQPLFHFVDDGVFISTQVQDPAQAVVTVRASVRTEGLTDASCQVVLNILDAAGRTVASGSVAAGVQPGVDGTSEQRITVPKPRLWSVDSPTLYTAVVSLQVDAEIIDEVRIPFGIRTIHFDPDQGFFLNGQPLKLKGVCCHQDHAGVGVALPDALQDYRIRRLKEMGCNAYRCSHNPPTPELLDACDRLGMLVMDEQRLLSSTPDSLGQLESLIRRDRNHPSVILWSLANEEPLQGTPMGARIATTMRQLVRRLDPTRLTTMAMNGGWGQGVSGVVDVQGCNYCLPYLDDFHRQFPKQPVVYAESCSTVSTRGIYANDAARGYVSAYDVNTPGWGCSAETNWLHCLERPFVSGTFIWTGFDYRGEPTPYAWPCISSHFGILDMCGFPKDNFYYYQAWWSDRTVLHLFPHWNWAGREGQPIEVWVHSNCDEVELLLNGKSLGRQKVRLARHLEWKVPYQPGVLTAKAWKQGKLAATTKVETTGAPAAIRLTPDRPNLSADGEDTTVVNVAVVDAKGRVVPTAENELEFSVNEAARILGVGNGDPSSHERDCATRRRAFNGLCQVILQTSGKAGVIQLTAQAMGLKAGAAAIQAKPAERRPAVYPVAASKLRVFECSPLSKAPADIRRVANPAAGMKFAPVTNVHPTTWFCNILDVHRGKHGLVYIRTTYEAKDASRGSLLYGADGPVRVWINGRVEDCRPDATNPAIETSYRAPVAWQKGQNEIVFALSTNHGKAWGVYATALTSLYSDPT